MIIPQFTLRWMLALLTLCGLFFLVVGRAVSGDSWAIGASLGVVSLLTALVLYAAAFFVAWLFSLLPLGRARADLRSPFRPAEPGPKTPGS